jgi:hypothetical protein
MKNLAITVLTGLSLFSAAAALASSATYAADCRMEPSANGKGWSWVCRQ